MKSFVPHTRFTIVGLGQLGASLGLRLRALGAQNVNGIDIKDSVVAKAVDLGAVDQAATSIGETLENTDITILCAPLTSSIDFVLDHVDAFRFGSIVTDVGSVKGPIVRALRQPLFDHGVYFVGSHPMAGSEKAGLDHASADLFNDRICFLTPTEEDDEEMLMIMHNIWSAIGCSVIELDMDRHDSACAFTSHALHMTAAAAVKSVLVDGDVEAKQLSCAGGFRDHTRIASSNVHMWTEICKHNAPAILEALTTFEAELGQIRKILEAGDWENLAKTLAESKRLRDTWYKTIYETERGETHEQTEG